MTEQEMKEANAKPGDLARKAKAKERQENASASLDTMLGLPSTVEVGGRTLQVFPVTLGRMGAFGEAQGRLGDLALLSLVEGKPELIGRLNTLLGRTGEGEQMDMEAVEAGLRFGLLSATPEQAGAMLDICECVLNGPGQGVTREELSDALTPPMFLTIYRVAVAASGLNP